MVQNSYKKALEGSVAEYRKLLSQRAELDKAIASLAETIVAELRLAARNAEAVDVTKLFDDEEMPDEEKKASLTEAIGDLLKATDSFMTASEITERLPRVGYSVSHYSDPLPTITTTLSRLVRSGDVIGQVVQGKMAYKWNTSPFKHSPLKFLGQRYREGGRRAESGDKAEPKWWTHMKEQTRKQQRLAREAAEAEQRKPTRRELREAKEAAEALEQFEMRKRIREFEAKKK